MKQETKLLIGKLAYILSNRRIKTELVKQDIRRFKQARAEQARQIQAALDEEHARGWGFRAIDGRRIDWTPFTAETVSYQ